MRSTGTAFIKRRRIRIPTCAGWLKTDQRSKQLLKVVCLMAVVLVVVHACRIANSTEGNNNNNNAHLSISPAKAESE